MSEDEKEVRRIVNIQFGGDTGTDADYLYEHDQLNELDGFDTCACTQRVNSQAGSESIGIVVSELCGRCQKFNVRGLGCL